MADSEIRGMTSQFTPIQFLKGVGPKRAEAFHALGIHTTMDLLRYIPRAYLDRSTIFSLSDLAERCRKQSLFSPEADEALTDVNFRNEATVIVRIKSIHRREFANGRKMLIATIRDDSAQTAELVFFQQIQYYERLLKEEQLYVVSGSPEFEERYRKLQFHHPTIEKVNEEDEELFIKGVILPQYPMTKELKNAGIWMALIRRLALTALETEQDKIQEIFPADILARYKLPESKRAFHSLHAPSNLNEIAEAKKRMKFEELFFFEMVLALRKRGTKVREHGVLINPKSAKARHLLDTLPFELTNAQKRVLNEIADDFRSGKPMNRLLQGDVGSGKTIVSVFAMLMAIESGYQTLIMAPTEILAEQHYRGITALLEGMDIKVVQLVGGQKKRVRNTVNDEIASGKANIIVGTHALFGGMRSKSETTIEYNRVGLMVIDEQHRFGVEQRAKLRTLAMNSHKTDEPPVPHILVMSATPIPRTLSMTLYGDLDVSIINEMPKNRKPIKTKVVFESDLHRYFEFIRQEVKKGRQAYIVYPLVEQSEKLELKSAVEHYEHLCSEIFKDMKVGLLHGQMLWYEKDDTMKAFKNKEYDILVATTVVEVGIDIPNATVMLIENAERFGLSQLHQLRGRVGRGAEQSYCFLATKDHFRYHIGKKPEELSAARATVVRLKTMEETTDGFVIAETDLKLRGPGDILGTRQSGLPDFRYTDLISDGDIISIARKEAFALIEQDPHLRNPIHRELRSAFLIEYSAGHGFFDVA